MKLLRLGSRGSALALRQSEWVRDRLVEHHPQLQVEIRVIRTTGDRLAQQDRPQGSLKGLFVKEIEESLLSREVDLAVHSLKDVPAQLPPGLTLGPFPIRQDARDALILNGPGTSLEALPRGARLGTSSLRRKLELKRLRPDVEVVAIRGNVESRLQKMEADRLDGIVLAAAGLIRLGLEDRISYRFSTNEMIPAPGQGALALELRGEDEKLATLLKALEDPGSRTQILAERAFQARFGGGCQLPMGAHAGPEEGEPIFSAFLAHPELPLSFRCRIESSWNRLGETALEAAEFFLRNGAEKLLGEFVSES